MKDEPLDPGDAQIHLDALKGMGAVLMQQRLEANLRALTASAMFDGKTPEAREGARLVANWLRNTAIPWRKNRIDQLQKRANEEPPDIPPI